MTEKDLQRAFNRCLVIRFETSGEYHTFLKEIKSFGGKWRNGKEIVFDESQLNSNREDYCVIAVDRDYTIAHVMAMCFHYGAYPTIDYKKFATHKCVVDVPYKKK